MAEILRFIVAAVFMLLPPVFCLLVISRFKDKYEDDETAASTASHRLRRQIMLGGAIMGLGFAVLLIGFMPTGETLGYYLCLPVAGAMLTLITFSGTY